MKRTSNYYVLVGFLQDELVRSHNGNLYTIKEDDRTILVNYSTPIAVKNEVGEVIINGDKYSVTTSKIQSQLESLCDRLNWMHSGFHVEDEKTVREYATGNYELLGHPYGGYYYGRFYRI